MGWFWESKIHTQPPTDPLQGLDPTLRAFLDTETPAPQSPPPPPPPPEPTLPTSPKPLVPAQSLYSDGRYAHIWSTYTPLQDIEASTQTDQKRLLDVLDGYKKRKTQIGRTALKNCAMKQSAVDECFCGGGVKARMTMCREENKKLEMFCHAVGEFFGSLFF